MISKLDELTIVIESNKPDIVCITETWLSPEVESNFVTLHGYSLTRSDRTLKKGGGTAIYIRENIAYKESSFQEFVGEEAEGTLVELHDLNMAILCVYIPPDRNAQTLGTLESVIFQQIDAQFSKSPDRKVVILGDFNRFDVRLLEASLSLTDIVDQPTRGKNILDHILISENLKLVYDSSQVSYNAPIGKSDYLTLLATPNNFTEYHNCIRKHIV